MVVEGWGPYRIKANGLADQRRTWTRGGQQSCQKKIPAKQTSCKEDLISDKRVMN